MGTREVYEQKMRSGNLHYDPTINPGLGSPRCPRWEWTINGVLHDFTAVAGSGVAALFNGIHSFNSGIPFISKVMQFLLWNITSYYAASSASHYGISRLTRYIEESHTSHNVQKKPT
ncbi:hypothetical protein MKX01_004574 [Papaver californicum]|nr:hypothetical protein MKX01_004574 [Papaver californicum]